MNCKFLESLTKEQLKGIKQLNELKPGERVEYKGVTWTKGNDGLMWAGCRIDYEK